MFSPQKKIFRSKGGEGISNMHLKPPNYIINPAFGVTPPTIMLPSILLSSVLAFDGKTCVPR